jgi:hypothetical protein
MRSRHSMQPCGQPRHGPRAATVGAPNPPGLVRFHQNAVTANAIAIGAADSDAEPSARKVMIPHRTVANPRIRCTTPVWTVAVTGP